MGKERAPSVSGLVVFLRAPRGESCKQDSLINLNNLLNQHFRVKLRKREKIRDKKSINEI